MNRVLLALAVLLIAFGAAAQTTNGLTKAEIEGRQLAQKLCEISPAANLTNTAVLEIHREGTNPTYPVQFKTILTEANWSSSYKVSYIHYDNSNNFGDKNETLTVIHANDQGNAYKISYVLQYGTKLLGRVASVGPNAVGTRILSGDQIMAPFADSDFWICDLGLEFFHWPDQKILRHEDKRTRACAVLESNNPNPGPGAYSRVDSWIDNETLGLVHAEAYDANGKLFKVFDPKSFKKVNGQWELQDMEIHNVQTKSRTSIKFDLKSK
jgi:hypothetical protein